MAEQSKISWTDSTFNPWIGCTKVSPGCDACYAEALDKRMRFGGHLHWGAGVPRMLTSSHYWMMPYRWNRKAEASGKRHLVFCASLADVFDNEVDPLWRQDLFDMIRKTPALTWQIVTKRIGSAFNMLPASWRVELPRNVWVIATVVNQEEAERDIPKLLKIPARVRGLSIEPMLETVRWWAVPGAECGRIGWVIYGGESSQGSAIARPCGLDWIVEGVARCRQEGAVPFVKQLGSRPFWAGGEPLKIRDRAGADPAEWARALQVQEFPC